MTAENRLRIMLTSTPGIVTRDAMARYGIRGRRRTSSIISSLRATGLDVEVVYGLGYRLRGKE